MEKRYIIVISFLFLFLLSALLVYAVSFPANGDTNWGTPLRNCWDVAHDGDCSIDLIGEDAVIDGANLNFEGATVNDFETTLTVVNPTADRTVFLPDATGTAAITNGYMTAPSTDNTVCSTTCGGIALCFIGMDNDAGSGAVFVTCSNAAADTCICKPAGF